MLWLSSAGGVTEAVLRGRPFPLPLPFALAIALVLPAGCEQVPSASGPLLVRAPDLARSYRDTPRAADDAYKGQVVLVPLANYVRRGGELHWHLADAGTPPVVVFQFAGELPDQLPPTVWVRGTCQGATPDGTPREFTGYTFRVHVTGCTVVPPPARQGP